MKILKYDIVIFSKYPPKYSKKHKFVFIITLKLILCKCLVRQTLSIQTRFLHFKNKINYGIL